MKTKKVRYRNKTKKSRRNKQSKTRPKRIRRRFGKKARQRGPKRSRKSRRKLSGGFFGFCRGKDCEEKSKYDRPPPVHDPATKAENNRWELINRHQEEQKRKRASVRRSWFSPQGDSAGLGSARGAY